MIVRNGCVVKSGGSDRPSKGELCSEGEGEARPGLGVGGDEQSESKEKLMHTYICRLL